MPLFAATFGFTTLLDYHTLALCNVLRFDVSVEGLYGFGVYFYPKNHTIGKAFNEVLSTNSGIIRYLKSFYTKTENSHCESGEAPRKGNDPLTITEVTGVILLLVFGAFLALCALAYECLWSYFHLKKTAKK
jgi:hypothetical protein